MRLPTSAETHALSESPMYQLPHPGQETRFCALMPLFDLSASPLLSEITQKSSLGVLSPEAQSRIRGGLKLPPELLVELERSMGLLLKQSSCFRNDMPVKCSTCGEGRLTCVSFLFVGWSARQHPSPLYKRTATCVKFSWNKTKFHIIFCRASCSVANANLHNASMPCNIQIIQLLFPTCSHGCHSSGPAAQRPSKSANVHPTQSDPWGKATLPQWLPGTISVARLHSHRTPQFHTSRSHQQPITIRWCTCGHTHTDQCPGICL